MHGEQHTLKRGAASYRTAGEAVKCYNRINKVIGVSNTVKEDFCNIFNSVNTQTEVLYNTNESEKIIDLSNDKSGTEVFSKDEINLISVGTIKPVKGFDRLIRVHARLRREGYPVHTYILGKGYLQQELEKIIQDEGVEDSITFLGYTTNPYKYVRNSTLFICSSLREGFSTAATEALIVGTPVCTVEVSGMKEMLGEDNEYGVVTENSEEALYQGIKSLLDNPDRLEYYKRQALIRGGEFSTEKTVQTVENMLINL